MILAPTTLKDIEHLKHWIKSDPYHYKGADNPEWWATGQGILSFRIEDESGPTMYVRTDAEDGLMRLHTQFAPVDEVTKPRVVKSILWTLPKLELVAHSNNLEGFIYNSTSPSLIKFMEKKFGFVMIGDDDYFTLF